MHALWRTGAFVLPAVLMLLRPAFAQEPLGSEFQVNTTTSGLQIYPAAAADDAGNFVVVWMSSGGAANVIDVFGQLYDAAGRRRGGEFVVNTSREGVQGFPAVMMQPSGGFVVVWGSTDPEGVIGRRYDAAGAPVGGEFVVFPQWPDNFTPAISRGAGGGFVVVWHYGDIFARRYDAAGTPLGGEMQVNSFTTGVQYAPSVGADAAGNFVVAWESREQDGSYSGIFARRYDASGAPRGAEFKVNTVTAGQQNWPAVAVDAAGNVLIAWEGPDGFAGGIFAQRYDATGAPLGGEFRVNASTTNAQRKPAATALADGSFIVSWPDHNPIELFTRIFGQRYDQAGTPLGGAFRADTYVPDTGRINPVIAAQPAGNFVMAWEGVWHDPSKSVFARRWMKLVPSAMSVDPSPTPGSDGNGVFEPGEQVAVAPSWGNAAGAPRTFQGEGIAFTGPTGGGPVYGLVDASADYGALADGSSTSCQAASGDCYVVSVSSPSNRPGVHWDATFDEALRPEALGQLQGWSLHIGRSFTDVPASSPFYIPVETVLHRGITAGCGGTNYCPALPTTREQMAPFLVVAKQGAGYTPPDCITPPFADVPASSAFCKWIQQLALRGVTAGCGGGNYCPTAAVSREQMAVFVLRTLDPNLNPPPCTTPVFNDVPADSPYCRWIEELARRGVVSGCAPGRYCPLDPVTREQMSVFLTGTFGLTLYGP